MSDLVTESAETLAEVRKNLRREVGPSGKGDGNWRPMVSAAEVWVLLDALDAVRPAAEVRVRLEALAADWEQEADEDERWLNGPRVAVSEAQEYPATIRQARAHATAIRAALAEEGGDRGEPACMTPYAHAAHLIGTWRCPGITDEDEAHK